MYTSMFRKAMLGDTATLNLDFTTGVLDSRLTFTRAANTATYINSSGYVTTAAANTPRFDYDPATLAPRGLLIEGQTQNVLYYSQDVTQSSRWTIQGGVPSSYTSVSATGGTAPDNTNTANLCTESTANNSRSIYQGLTAAAGTYTASVWVKAGTGSARYIRLVLPSAAGNFVYVTVNISTGAVTQAAAAVGTASAASATVTPYAGSWYRIQLTGTLAAAVNFVFIVPLDSATPSVNTGDYGREAYVGNGSTFLIWGAQLESGSGASSYIPTGASQVTRNGDSCVMTGTNFSSWFAGATEGVLFAQYEKPRSQSGNAAHDFSAVGSRYTTGAGFILYAGNSNYYPTTILWPTGGAIFGGGIATAIPSVTKQAGKWFGGNDVTNYSNGVVGTTVAGTGTLTPAMLSFGANSATGTEATRDWLNACIRQVKFYPTALSDAAIQTLTTT